MIRKSPFEIYFRRYFKNVNCIMATVMRLAKDSTYLSHTFTFKDYHVRVYMYISTRVEKINSTEVGNIHVR